jgi:hypothetical protein
MDLSACFLWTWEDEEEMIILFIVREFEFEERAQVDDVISCSASPRRNDS